MSGTGDGSRIIRGHLAGFPGPGIFPYVTVDAAGHLVVVVAPFGGVTRYNSGGVATNGVISAAAATPCQFIARNDSAQSRFFHVFNLAALPPNGTVPDLVPQMIVGNGGVLELSFPWPAEFSVGITWCSSTTRDSLTLTGAADLWVNAWYV